MNIIIPSYSGHVNQCRSFLKSAQQLASDHKDIQFKVIISKADQHVFEPMLRDASLSELNIVLITLKAILAHYTIDIDETELLNTWGKFTFQSVKKLMGAYHFGADWSLLVDSEALVVRPCSFATILENYRQRNVVFYSSYIGTDLQREVTDNVARIFGDKIGDMWLFDQQSWFVEHSILSDLLEHLGGPSGLVNTMVARSPIFEMVLYYWWIYKDKERYGYNFMNYLEELRPYLDASAFSWFAAEVKKHSLTPGEFCGLGMSPTTVPGLSLFHREKRIAFFRPTEQLSLRASQEQFIRTTPSVKILACCPEAPDFASAAK
jgi:hypothetical protein